MIRADGRGFSRPGGERYIRLRLCIASASAGVADRRKARASANGLVWMRAGIGCCPFFDRSDRRFLVDLAVLSKEIVMQRSSHNEFRSD